MKMRALTATILAALAASAVLAASERGDTWSAYGTPVKSQNVDRIVHLKPHSRWVNVNDHETVRFVAQSGNGSDQSFAWKFNVSAEVHSFALSEIAPPDFPERQVRVWVDPDPLYTSN